MARWWARWRPAWLTGADLRILNQVSSEWSFYDLLGVAVFGLTCFSGFSATLALGYVLATPALDLWWFGVLWTIGLLFCVERIILSVPTTRKRSTFYASLAFRGALSIVIALMLAEPMLVRLNEREVNDQLSVEHREAREHADAAIRAHFNPLIRKTREELRSTRDRKIELQRQVAEYRRRRGEAAEAGCGANCVFFAQTAAAKESRLRAVEERNVHRQPDLHAKIKGLSAERAERIKEEHEAIERDDGFWARLGALSAVIEQRPYMTWELWGLRIGFFLFDLAPLLALVFYLKRDAPKPYEDLRVAYWHLDALVAKEIRGNTDVREHEIRERAKADKEVVQAEIMLEADRRMAEAGLDGTVGSREGFQRDGAVSPVTAPNLADYVGDMRPHEREPVMVSPELRRGGIIGAVAIGVSALLATVWSAISGHTVGSLWLAVGLLCGVGALALLTHGFRRAPAWALWAIFAVLILGLSLPLLLLLTNV